MKVGSPYYIISSAQRHAYKCSLILTNKKDTKAHILFNPTHAFQTKLLFKQNIQPSRTLCQFLAIEL